MGLPSYLYDIQSQIRDHAASYGLDFFDTIFEMVDYDQMNEVASYLGFPTRYPHWRFGMEYERMAKSYAWGLSKIYELVINNDPCYAYLLEGNSLVEQKMVMAHVYGHCDFFKNNAWFSHTNRKMMDEMANHAARIRGYIERYGLEEVENFLDVCLSLDNLIDLHAPFIRRQRDRQDEDVSYVRPEPKKIQAKSYLDKYVNPQDFMEEQRKKIEEDRQKAKRTPEDPEKDVLLFLLDHAPLKKWQRSILSMVREEAYYFAPQGQTKIMNEGWASYWHSTMMTQRVLDTSEILDYANTHAGSMVMGRTNINPYKIGLELYRDIEDRWNKGKFGKEWEECDDMAEKANWNRNLGLGKQKIFEVRRIYNDVSFIDTFLTPEFCWANQLFTYEYNAKSGQFEIFSRDFKLIKEKLLFQLTNHGQPFIYVEDSNHANRGELLLWHKHEGTDLNKQYAQDVLGNIHKVWQRPVHIRTMVNGKPRLWSHDGTDFKESAWSQQV